MAKKNETKKTLWNIASDLEDMTVQIDRVKSLISLSFGVFDECPQLHKGFGHYYEATLDCAVMITDDIAERLKPIVKALYEKNKEESES